MRATSGAVLVGAFLWIGPAWAGGPPRHTLYVDCDAAPGGTGTRGSPYDTIGAALAAGEPLADTGRVTVDVTGTCDAEVFPLALDYPVDLVGQRIPKFDSEGFPIDGQYLDTLITWATAPAAPSVMLLITGEGIRISRISVDGKMPPIADGAPGVPSFVPVLEATGADGLSIDYVRIVGAAACIRAGATSLVLANSYLSAAASIPVNALGGPADDPSTVLLLNNRLDYRTEGIAAAGAFASTLYPGALGGDALDLVVIRNDFVTTYTNTGPTNPNALRISPGLPAGSAKVTMLWNRVRGPAKYNLVFHGGQPRRDAVVDYTGTLEAVLFGTTFDAAAGSARTVITFTGIRATALPCELDPDIPRFPDCPLANNRWEYLEGAVYELWHSGELDDAWIDHPEIEPVDGRVLDNLLIINDEIIDNQTFVVIP